MRKVEFESLGSVIKGYFFPAKNHCPSASVIFLQGFPGVEGDELICARLSKEHVNVLTFNYQGTFQSDGFFSFGNAIHDIGAAIQFLKEPQIQAKYGVDPAKLVLGGWSFGSGIVPAGAARYAEISRMFCISGRDFYAEACRVEQKPEYAGEVFRNLEAIRRPNGPVNFRDGILDDLVNLRELFDPQKLAQKLQAYEILLIGGWNDGVSAIEDHLIPFYRSLIENGNQKVRIEALNGDHAFTNCKDQLAALIVEWING